ncbi:MAG TPA: metal-dependent hydrolase, partial [Candidatus Acidoferrales bacterium]|nr:metal-dependent hydrolase [Candidatus Acidoferrales bacterium]
MDPITHGLTGALLGKAFFTGPQSSAPGQAERARIAVYAATLGSVFPDIDVLLGPLTRNDLATIQLHRGFTHSFSGIPAFAILLATLTHGYVRRRGLGAPSWGSLTVVYGLGIASHVLLDVITSFGTMIWSPWNHTRVAWDLVSIVDFAMTAVVLLPHVLARVYRSREGSLLRAARGWIILSLCAIAAAGLVAAAGFPTSVGPVVAASVIFAVLLFLPT